MVQVPLHKANNPSVRPRSIEEDLSVEEKLFRKLQGILNKLTPQKFQALAEQALLLKISTEQQLKGCTDKIYYAVCACMCVVILLLG